MKCYRINVAADSDKQAITMGLEPVAAMAPRLRMGGWLAPRRSPLVHVERSRGYVAHVWVGALGLHLAWPPHHSRLDFCADWWR